MSPEGGYRGNLTPIVNLKDRVGDALLTHYNSSITVPVTRDESLDCFIIHLPEGGQVVIYDEWLYRWRGNGSTDQPEHDGLSSKPEK